MANHAYVRTLAAPSVTPLAGMQAAVRVKLVFADELATFVLRHRGFSSCWYLIPRSSRLVGDLVHEIMEEFELLERCPRGVAMVLDGFHVLANQNIEMMRDNDTLVVQCSAFAAEPSRSKERKKMKRSESGVEEEEGDKRVSKKAKVATKSDASGQAKKRVTKKVAKAAPPVDSSSDESSDDSDDEQTAPQTAKKGVRKVSVAANPPSGSSSDDSSSSEDEKTAPPTPKQRAFKALVKDTVREMNDEVVTVQTSTSSSSSSSSSSSDSDSDSSDDSSDSDDAVKSRPVKKKPEANGTNAATPKAKKLVKEGDEQAKGTRRRRRPRRRPKGDTTRETTTAVVAAMAKPATLPAVPATPATQANATPKEIRPLRIRGVPPASKQGGKLHMRFDKPNQPVALPPPVQAHGVSRDLQKYGPAPVKASEKPSDLNGEEVGDAPSNTKKKPQKEMWKRPYEIISSIHDETPEGDATTTAKSKPTVDALVAVFPSKPSDSSSLPTPSGLQADDIIAYKTLTLCMETWQPIVSEWKCGKVLSLQDSDNTVVLQPHDWILPATSDGQLAWEPTLRTDDDDAEASVSISELSELRYLQGPTKAL